MKNLRNAVEQNQRQLEADIQWLERYRNGFFADDQRRIVCDTAKNQLMAVIVSGKGIISLIASFEFDVKLYKDTRDRHTASGGQTTEVVPFGAGVIATRGGTDGILRIDDRIVAAKNSLLAKINEYNGLIQAYRANSNFRWRTPANFVAIDGV